MHTPSGMPCRQEILSCPFRPSAGGDEILSASSLGGSRETEPIAVSFELPMATSGVRRNIHGLEARVNA